MQHEKKLPLPPLEKILTQSAFFVVSHPNSNMIIVEPENFENFFNDDLCILSLDETVEYNTQHTALEVKLEPVKLKLRLIVYPCA